MSAAHGRLCRFDNLENFCYLYVTIEGSARPKRHVQFYRPEQERCSPTDAMPDTDTITIIKRYPDQKTGLRIRNHYEKPAVECGTNRNGLTQQQLVRNLSGMSNNFNQLLRLCHQRGLDAMARDVQYCLSQFRELFAKLSS